MAYNITMTVGLGSRNLSTIVEFIRDDSGATMIEYSLIAALVTLGALAGFKALGTELGQMYDYLTSQIIPAYTG